MQPEPVATVGARLARVTSPFGRLTVIANPAAGKGRVREQLPVIERVLRASGLEHRVELTAGPGDATRLATSARELGSRFVVAVGGDGTTHEVVNGLMGGSSGERPVLGVISAGSGSDLSRTFDLPADTEAAATRLAGDAVRQFDIARISYTTPAGLASRYFANIAEVGFGAANVRRALTLPRGLGGRRYFVAFWLALPGYRVGAVRISAGGETYAGRAVNVVIANGQYFGSGMWISPKSRVDDGRLEVLAFTGPKSDSFTLVSKFYKGSHLPHPNVRELGGPIVTVDADEPQLVEADGESLGTTPVRCEVIRDALRLKV